jgi:hypothetical protein
MFPTALQLLPEVYSCTKELFGRKFSLNDCNVLYFSERMPFQEHFEVTTYNYILRSKTFYLEGVRQNVITFTTTRCINFVRNNTPNVVAETKQ